MLAIDGHLVHFRVEVGGEVEDGEVPDVLRHLESEEQVHREHRDDDVRALGEQHGPVAVLPLRVAPEKNDILLVEEGRKCSNIIQHSEKQKD